MSDAFFAIKRFYFRYTDKFSELCSKQKNCNAMKRFVSMLTVLLALGACSNHEGPEGNPSQVPQTATLYHGMIQLGEKLEDPYTVENMRAALTKAYPTKADRIDITATDLYVRFLPVDDNQLKELEGMGLYLMDHPMDYRIVREGDYYQDPDVGEEAITWQYAVVPQDFVFPEGIRYELLDECYLAEHDPTTRGDLGIDWELVEREAFRLTGNEDLLAPQTKGPAAAPAGRITIEDPNFSGGKPFGVAGVKVVCNIFIKIATCYTDRDGYYQMEKKFSGNPRYRIVFQNEKGFCIGFNWIIVPASVSTLGKAEPQGMDVHVNTESDGALFRRCTVNNAAYDYLSRCTDTDLAITAPPGDLRFWIFPDLSSSSACMLHHGAFLNHSLVQAYLGGWAALIKLFLPDITIGTKEDGYQDIYSAVVHEMSHASHYAKVGNDYWTPYIDYIISSFIREGHQAYGTGDGKNAGYCEVGEMWAYFMQSTLEKDRYSGSLMHFNNLYWFKPDIFLYLYERGMSRAEIFHALSGDVTSIDDLKEQLVALYPDREKLIVDTFREYGK